MRDTRIALLRGINVGRAKRVAMADLREMIAGLGYTDVKTLLNSGNVVFRAPGAPAATCEARIGAGLEEELGVSARIVVITGEQLEALIAEDPLGAVAVDASKTLVGVLADPQDPADRAALADLAAQDWGDEILRPAALAAWMWLPGGIHTSPLVKALEKAMKGRITSRNRATLLKLKDLAEGL